MIARICGIDYFQHVSINGGPLVNYVVSAANVVLPEGDNVRQLDALLIDAGLLDLVAVLPPDEVHPLVQVIEATK